MLQRAEEPFDNNIILRSAFGIHRYLYPAGQEDSGEISACELTPLVGVEYLRRRIFSQRFPQGIKAERDIQRGRDPVAQNLPTIPVDDGDQIAEAPGQPDVSDV